LVNQPSRRLPSISKWPDGIFLLLFFLYALAAGLLVQLVLLPYVFPAWNNGEGMLRGLDSKRFHLLAVQQAQKISAEGWQVWTLAPEGQPVSGIASAFYAAFTPHPWVLLPLNAFLHAMAALVLYKILGFFLEKRSHAVLAALPFLLFPTALSWVTQMHNDNYTVTGGVLMMYGWVCFARQETWQNRWVIFGGVLAFVVGGGLIWLVRDYVIYLLAGVGGILLTFLVLVFLGSLLRSRWSWRKSISATGIVSLAFITVASLQKVKIPDDWPMVAKGYRQYPPGLLTDSATTQPADQKTINQSSKIIWHESRWLPHWVDRQMESLSMKRTRVIKAWTRLKGGPNGSNIDDDVTFQSAVDIVHYLPRAAQIGFLSPFPSVWFGLSNKAPNTMMRRVSGFEMSYVYLCWPGLLYALWTWRKHPEIWAGILFCTGMVIINALGTPNVGTLVRFRYPYFMPMVGLGTAGWMVFIRDLSNRAKNRLKASPPLSGD